MEVSLFLLENSKVMDFPYPYNEKIAPCGYHIKNRKCDNSLKKITNKSPAFIRFVPTGYLTTDDFLPDFGFEFGKGGKPFGWNRSINDRLKQRFNPSKQELETLIMFPPDSKSIYCNNPAPDNLCEPVSWSAKVGKGLFIVRLYIGDPKESFISDLEVNKKIFTKSMVIEKNKMEIVEKIVESINGFITISASCTENCDNSVNRISAIKITPFIYDDDLDVNPLKGPKETPTNCGKAFTGGRCISGPDVLHCIFNDPTIEAASFCTEDNILKAIPNNYACKDQIGHYKCVKKLYINEDECKLYCPTKCLAERCA